MVEALNLGIGKATFGRDINITAHTRDHPDITRMIVGWAKGTISRDVGHMVEFASIYITKNFPLEARHRDVSNRGKVQVWRTLGNFTGGQLLHWPSDAGGDAAGEELRSLRSDKR